MSKALDSIAARLGHAFKDPALLQRALTHRSADSQHNERLEYLGDAVLGAIIAEQLFQLLPDADEGRLSRLRAALVKGETLAELAAELDLGNGLVLGTGEQKSGGAERTSTLADAFEAVIGAIFLDSDFRTVRGIVRTLYADRLENLPDPAAEKDPKTRLQEWLQARQADLPVYEVTRVEGEAHAQTFAVACRVDGLNDPALGEGTSRRKAEQAAAKAALQSLMGQH